MVIHELLKIKVRAESREEKQQIIDKIVASSAAEVVQVIGGVLVIYKPFDEEPVITLPRK
jgi:RNA-binding protein